ncbi:MAG: Glu/Leu/Phe/Val dehydrogenase dimerization domain-containing protein [Gemmatimonadales bacterium]
MTDLLKELVRSWEGEAVVTKYDRPTGTWIFIALHSTALGAAFGGCRMRVYERPEDGLEDAMRLAEGMTHKWAAVEMEFGGGKSVLAVKQPLTGGDRAGLLRRFGHLLETLGGRYMAGVDLGTTPEDMRTVNEVTSYVCGADRNRFPIEDPGPFTATGVLMGIRAALQHRFGDESIQGRRILIQGVGDVGAPLAHMLNDEGASLTLTDIDQARARTLADELGAEIVAPERALEVECNIYAPCAVGATLNATSIPKLQCDVVAGSANNQLSESDDANRLHDRGILYAPDYVINAGGAIAFGMMFKGMRDEAGIRLRVERIRDSLREIFDQAARRNESPLVAARKRVDRVLETARRQS